MMPMSKKISIHSLHAIKMAWYDLVIKIRGAYWFFNYQMRNQEKMMAHRYYKINPSEKTLEPCVVFTCNGFTWAGGLADRLKGIISVFHWCQQNNRKFIINFCEPFKLEDYLVPNHYDWLPNGVSYDASNVQPRICLREPRTGKYLAPQWDELWPTWMESFLGDVTKQYHIYTNMYLSDFHFSDNFNKLFRPCERLQKEIVFHLQQMGEDFISISFRFTTLLGDFTDCTEVPLPENEQILLIEKSLEAVSRISAEAPAHDKILVTADSEKYLERAKKLKNVYIVPGKTGHIDYDHSDEVNMKTFLDFFLISKAKAVYLAKGSKMYNSAFAKTAAMVNNRPFEVYEY